MPTYGKLEARITIPTGGWVAAFSDGVVSPITVPAGTYYHSTGDVATSFAATLESAINSGLGGGSTGVWTVTFAGGEEGTGKYVISCTVTSSITWTDTELRDLLGFTGDVSGATVHTAPDQAQGIWFASYPFQKKNGLAGGSGRVSDQQIAMNSNGNVYSVMGRSYKTARIKWPMERRNKCWTENELSVNESFETFLVDGIWGTSSWGTSTGPVRFHPDADDNTDFGTFSVLGLESWDPSELVEHWAQGRWQIELPHLIEVPE